MLQDTSLGNELYASARKNRDGKVAPQMWCEGSAMGEVRFRLYAWPL
jgi:hypothetical protein